MGGMVGLLSLVSTTWTRMTVVVLSDGFPLSTACTTSLWGKKEVSSLIRGIAVNKWFKEKLNFSLSVTSCEEQLL